MSGGHTHQFILWNEPPDKVESLHQFCGSNYWSTLYTDYTRNMVQSKIDDANEGLILCNENKSIRVCQAIIFSH